MSHAFSVLDFPRLMFAFMPVFGLVVVAHIWRVIEEGPHIATDPVFIVITILAGAMSFWAWWVLRPSGRS